MSSEANQTRNRILDATWNLLESKHGAAVRMADVARAAGISRQAVYLHFESRAELLIATTRYVDERKDVGSRLAKSRAARSGEQRLDAFVEAWCSYIPEIYPVARALMAAAASDDAAAAAWDNRMSALREGCVAAVKALERDGRLTADYGRTRAVDLMWTVLSVRNYEHLALDCGWSQKRYVEAMRGLLKRTLVADG